MTGWILFLGLLATGLWGGSGSAAGGLLFLFLALVLLPIWCFCQITAVLAPTPGGSRQQLRRQSPGEHSTDSESRF